MERFGFDGLVKRLSSYILCGFSVVSQVGCGSFAKLATILSQNMHCCKSYFFFSAGSQCWYFSHEPSSLFHHSVLVDLNVSMMMH